MKNRLIALCAVLILSVFVITPVQAAGSEEDKQLLEAASHGNVEEMQRLLAAGADVSAKDFTGWTPLHFAINNGHTPVVKALIKHNADVGVKLKYSGWTPLHLAALRGRATIVPLLIARGASVNAVSEQGETPLHFSVYCSDKQVVKLLLDNGADIHAQNSEGRTALHLAAEKGYTQVSQLLAARDANVNAVSKTGNTPLHLAAAGGHIETAKLLIVYGADIGATNRDGYIPLTSAIITRKRVLPINNKETANLLHKAEFARVNGEYEAFKNDLMLPIWISGYKNILNG